MRQGTMKRGAVRVVLRMELGLHEVKQIRRQERGRKVEITVIMTTGV